MLQQRAIEALNTPGVVPDELKEDLGLAVADVLDRTESECAARQAPPPPTVEEDDDEGHGKKKGKKNGHGGKDDD